MNVIPDSWCYHLYNCIDGADQQADKEIDRFQFEEMPLVREVWHDT